MSEKPVSLLIRERCRIPLGEPGDAGEGWRKAAVLPVPRLVHYFGTGPIPETQVRAMAGETALHVRFDSPVSDMRLLRPFEPAAPVSSVERAWIELAPHNDATLWWRFQVDWRGGRDMARFQRVLGERSLEEVPDVWEGPLPIPGGADWNVFHGLTRKGWWAEFEIPWTLLGLAGRPAALGAQYGRVYNENLDWPTQVNASWTNREITFRTAMDHGEFIVGPDAAAPDRLDLDHPCFGLNRARLFLAKPGRAKKLLVRTESADGKIIAQSSFAIRGATVPFEYRLDRAFSSHVEVFQPPRLALDLCDAGGVELYRVRLPMDRHLGICVDEPYGVHPALRAPHGSLRDAWLNDVTRALPRLHRRTTAQGAPSDFCLCFDDGSVAANLMADDAWPRLAAIVEDRFVTPEDRLVAAMALVGQKSLANLIIVPNFLSAAGEAVYPTMLDEVMGPLSILRYGGGPAAAVAAVLARLLQYVHNPATGKPFVTRVLSLSKDGGPRQNTRRFSKPPALNAFQQFPGLAAAVAVEHGRGLALLDPVALVFPRPGRKLATMDEMLSNARLREAGAGRLAGIYAKVDADEVLRQPPDRLLSRGVFPELAPDEDGVDRPFDPRLRNNHRVLIAGDPKRDTLKGFVDMFGRRGPRDGEVRAQWDGSVLTVRVKVADVKLGALKGKDHEVERVHLGIDSANDHYHYRHFMASPSGERGAWCETSGGIQTLYKHLCSQHWNEERKLKSEGLWQAQVKPLSNGYEATFRIGKEALGIEGAVPRMGFNVWIDCRAPHYGQVFLAPLSRTSAAADPPSFAHLYLGPQRAVIGLIDLGVPQWEENTGRVAIANLSRSSLRVSLRAETRLTQRRHVDRCRPVSVMLPPGKETLVEFPYYLNPEEKMGGNNLLTLSANAEGKEFFRGTWIMNFASVPGVYQRFGSAIGQAANPKPGERDFIRKKVRYICSRIPQFRRLTTRDGAPSDFFLRAEDGSVEFNLMEPGVLDQMGDWAARRFDTDLDRVLGLFFLGQNPAVIRHLSGGHRIMAGGGPLSVLRGNFAGGGGNCGFHSRAFAGMLCHLRIGGKPLEAHTVSVWSHVIVGFNWRGSKSLVDNDVGHFYLTPDGRDIPTIEALRTNPAMIGTSGPGEVARYLTITEGALRARILAPDEAWHGVFPPGAPKA